MQLSLLFSLAQQGEEWIEKRDSSTIQTKINELRNGSHCYARVKIRSSKIKGNSSPVTIEDIASKTASQNESRPCVTKQDRIPVLNSKPVVFSPGQFFIHIAYSYFI